jgi:hypothetical protein
VLAYAKRESAEADSRRSIPDLWSGQIPEGARWRGRNYLVAKDVMSIRVRE